MILIIDNYDSFTYNLARYVEELGAEVTVVRNDEITMDELVALNPEGIIISPGPKRPEDTGICIDVIENFKNKLPILGICLGHQTIGHVFGAKVIRGKAPVHGKLCKITHSGTGVFSGLKSPITVTRYHSLIVEEESLPHCLEVTSKADDGTIMGIRHVKYEIEGVQFHPEAELTQYGHELLRNFLKKTKLTRRVKDESTY